MGLVVPCGLLTTFGGFSPLDLSPELWLDANDAGTLYDATSGGSLVSANGTVARWEDKSGNGKHAIQTTFGSRPIFRSSSALNSLGAVDFDASRFFSLSSTVATATEETLLFVFRRSSGFVNAILTRADSASRYGPFWYSDNNAYYSPLGGFGFGSSTATGTQLLTGTANSANLTVRRNGAQIGTAARSAGASAYDTIGRRVIGGEYHNDLIGEIIVISRTLTSDELALVENHLIEKWSIS